ncbi:aminopeptidase P family protein [Rhodoligotrophos defluvii]|uniref:aminopeptidase P family protein n=1 Tax=Rhodoligotrophos defluvii TaxID=2561934 RepID=UPI0010C9598A|nr:aminopeptidase P family protein [Rhodoligotrophos defluvii]
MFQSFEGGSNHRESAERIAALRDELLQRGLDGYIVPRADEHQGEYVAPHAERLRWLTGFSGSAGLAVILLDQAVLFVDGRYTIQARNQVDTNLIELRHLVEEPPAEWLRGALKRGQRIGYDPWLLTMEQVERYTKACAAAEAEMVAVEDANLVDAIWREQPPKPTAPLTTHPTQYAGRRWAEKRTEIEAALARSGADAVVFTQPDSIAWAFNIRGADIAHTPVALAFAIVPREGRPELFVDPAKVDEDVRAQLAGDIDLRPQEELSSALAALGSRHARVLLDPAWTASRIADLIERAGGEIVQGSDPCILPKARKNPVELEGARMAHRRDAVAVVQFLAWFDREAPTGKLDEIAAAEALEQFRRETGLLKEISFDTISAAGPHAAIPHYRVTRESNREIRPGEIYLIDSGAQYLDGTTDITRTVIVGEATAEMRDRFTRVLKGMIAVTLARFPQRTNGAQLDAFARAALWQAGLDFDHGTGHGVGSYLSVHEGPARIAKTGIVPLETGMILSNEPGYYKEGEYGIRIENLVVVRAPEPIPGGDRPMHSFETLTLAPIDRRLIATDLLDERELAWLNAYHQRVHDEVGPLLDPDAARWLAQATAPLR